MSEQTLRSIWKYPISEKPFSHEMPAAALILTVQMQGERPYFWALVNTEAPTVRRYFAIIATGQPFDTTNTAYHGTFQLYGGALVFHLFEFSGPDTTP